MPRRTRQFRLFAFALVVLQLALRPAAGLVEARQNAESGPWTHFVHFESKGSTHIPPVHDVDCGLCVYLSAPFARASALALELPLVARGTPAELRAANYARTAPAALPPARAPPAV